MYEIKGYFCLTRTESGKKADLVVLDRDLFETDPYEIHQAEVVMTVMDGEVVFEMPAK